jgi:hypothetical protein
MHARFRLIGKRFGLLTVVEYLGSRAGARRWRCQCDCGESIESTTGALNAGTKSCGCLQRHAAARACISRSVHGLTGTRLYVIWRAMRSRCSNPKNIGWKDYGGRGIRVCDEWSDFPVFKAWAFANGYDSHLSIDRRDNNGNYEPGNCRWATMIHQNRNRRSGFTPIVHDGQSLSVAEWSKKTGVPSATIRYRLARGLKPPELFR